MTKQHTVALRICIGCRTPFGVHLWPWSGERFTHTHGLCRACFERWQGAFDAEREASPGVSPSVSAGSGC